MTTFATMTEAIEYVETALGDFADRFDAEAIAREVTDWIDGKLTLTTDGDEFWAVAERHDLDIEDEDAETVVTDYMKRQGFGDYSKADAATREEMENLALEHAAREQTRPSIFRELGAERARESYENGTATQADLINLIGLGDITKEDAEDYYRAHGWTLPKYGFR